MKAAQRRTLMLGGIIAFVCILLGAFGAHALKETLSDAGSHQYDLGVRYAFIHAFALISSALASPIATNMKRVHQAQWFFVAGIILFSGSLVILGVTSIRALAYITPLGGICFLLGWSLFIFSMRGEKT